MNNPPGAASSPFSYAGGGSSSSTSNGIGGSQFGVNRSERKFSFDTDAVPTNDDGATLRHESGATGFKPLDNPFLSRQRSAMPLAAISTNAATSSYSFTSPVHQSYHNQSSLDEPMTSNATIGRTSTLRQRRTSRNAFLSDNNNGEKTISFGTATSEILPDENINDHRRYRVKDSSPLPTVCATVRSFADTTSTHFTTLRGERFPMESDPTATTVHLDKDTPSGHRADIREKAQNVQQFSSHSYDNLPHSQHTNSTTPDTWVLVYGFHTHDQYSEIVALFGTYGVIENRVGDGFSRDSQDHGPGTSAGNWVALQYQSPLQAAKALCHPHVRLKDGMTYCGVTALESNDPILRMKSSSNRQPPVQSPFDAVGKNHPTGMNGDVNNGRNGNVGSTPSGSNTVTCVSDARISGDSGGELSEEDILLDEYYDKQRRSQGSATAAPSAGEQVERSLCEKVLMWLLSIPSDC